MVDLIDTRMVNTGAVLVLVNREVGEKARDSYVLANGTFQHDEIWARGRSRPTLPCQYDSTQARADKRRLPL
ncbi:MAG: hypothetical protein M3Q03_13355 [Chloroflexota bacterium]|nr:hypothetical protein [Chloroflexota bacterium]